MILQIMTKCNTILTGNLVWGPLADYDQAPERMLRGFL